MDIHIEKFRRYLQKDSSLPNEVIDAFVNGGKSRKYKKGDFFSKQDEISDKSGYICAGMFNVFSIQEDGKLFVVTFMKKNDFVQSRLDFSAPSKVTIQALCETVVIEYQTKVLHDMYLQYSQLGNFIRYLAEKYLSIYTSHMIQIGTKKALDNYLLFQNNSRVTKTIFPSI